jgi:hypothetical protein
MRASSMHHLVEPLPHLWLWVTEAGNRNLLAADGLCVKTCPTLTALSVTRTLSYHYV